MVVEPYNYNIFFDFIECYLPSGFLNINSEDPIIKKLDACMEVNDQYFQVGDLGKMKFLYTSKNIIQMLGITPEEITPGHYTQLIHPDDEEILGQSRSRVFKLEKDIFKAQSGSILTSFCLRNRNLAGVYDKFLVQDYLFFSPKPHKAVFLIQVLTKINWFKKKKNCFHYYVGNDISMFRFPDEKLLMIGPDLSTRELEILRLIETGLSTKEISKKLFLSDFTISTHRTNILQKSNKKHISDLIYELKESGLL